MTVPGVNLICAASFIAAVGDANRFLTSRKLVAYLGLDPQGPPVRRGTGAQRPDLKARVGVARAGRWSRRRGARCCSPARCTRFYERTKRPARARQSDRRDRPQARGPVLVHAHPRTRTTPTSNPR